jgi:hypothetical protein
MRVAPQHSGVYTCSMLDRSKGGRPGRCPEDITHGTRAGYAQHTRLGVEPCAECRAANAEYFRARRRKQDARPDEES